ncbi:hypothetical protein EVAR_14285_1 [Eumeta japonica]|uniref:Uncharacterized protein n=1 Tax=Eumeta variegata TaxID=151549 RepID=A0A4C1UNP7_EUMVA|nr:hypothetical protein EVAR_14285_1 [Eumeta japonica]
MRHKLKLRPIVPLYCSALSLARAAQAERDNASCFFNYSVLSRFDGPGCGSASDRVSELNTSGRTGEGRGVNVGGSSSKSFSFINSESSITLLQVSPEQWKHTAEHFIPAFRHPHIAPQFPLHLQKINFRSFNYYGSIVVNKKSVRKRPADKKNRCTDMNSRLADCRSRFEKTGAGTDLPTGSDKQLVQVLESVIR